MLIAGFSEFLIIFGLIWVATQQSFSKHGLFRNLLHTCLFITALAASLGALKYLTLVNLLEAHGVMTFLSKHLAMPCICLLTVLHINKTFKQSKPIEIAVLVLATLSLVSFALNLWHSLSFMSDAIIIGSLMLGMQSGRGNPTILLYLGLGIICLSSTIIWGLLLSDSNLRIGAFHAAVSLFLFFLGLTFYKIKTEKI